ncbi:hypothetical protein EMPS_02686 [Entomortierella parvispora]|uniref:TNT domain-containing protein n=1 Tax=Entomortierella parvispora TaxID=205924 RepID=A0A9P3H5W9_9FUNG|nr:hypothetical protein EMPS_02686 [Entomortierella parvispora]
MLTSTSRLVTFALVLCSVLSAVAGAPVDVDSSVDSSPLDDTFFRSPEKAAAIAGDSEEAKLSGDEFASENNYNKKCPDMCKGVAPVNSTFYFCRDARLGPKHLPKLFPLNDITDPYDRLGGLCAAEFLAKWTVNGSYTYPVKDGFLLNIAGEPIKGTAKLLEGTLLDRFGSEYGSFLSPAEAPYPQRSIPPSNLDAPKDQPLYPFNYHVYKVIKPFDVEAGPIAPYFGQPGAGTQYHTFSNIMKLLADGFLERVSLKNK